LRLRDGHGVVRERLEQERLELVVGAVDLVDQQNRRHGRIVVDGREQRSTDEIAVREELIFELVGIGIGRRTGGFGRSQMEQLAGVVPLVERLGRVDALVALEPNEFGTGGCADDLGHLRLAHTSLALEQQRPLEMGREEDRGGEPAVRQIIVTTELGEHRIDRLELGMVQGHPTTIGHPGRFTRGRLADPVPG